MLLTCQHCYKAWVPWAGTNIQHIQYVFSCKTSVFYRFLLFQRWVLSFPHFSGKCELITIRSLTWRVLGRCLYCSVLGMLQYLYSNSMNERVLWKHCWKSALLSSLGLGFLLYCYMLQAWQKLKDEEYNFCNKIVILNVKAPSSILLVCMPNSSF